jgi:hypothetical protein
MWLNFRVKKIKALRVTMGSFTTLFLSLACFSLPFTTKKVPVSLEIFNYELSGLVGW